MAFRPDPVEVALRIERAEAMQLAETGSPGRAGALELAGGIAVSKGPRSPFSAAFALGLGGPVSDEDLERVESHLGALGGDVRIELCASCDPSFGDALSRRGYGVERFHQVWWRSPGRVHAPMNGARIRQIRRDEERAWAEAFARAHLGARLGSFVAVEAILAIVRAKGSVCYAAFDGGAPVAVAIVSAHRGVAMLSAAGVVPEKRGHGLQLALAAARLAWAEEQGCDVAASVTAAGTASQRNLEKAGFRAAYPKVVMVRRG
jgi:GNAT superfamily N-acetyltransferase